MDETIIENAVRACARPGSGHSCRIGVALKTLVQFHEEADFLRESSGSTNIERTLLKARKKPAGQKRTGPYALTEKQ
jgi:hypothetical protein